MPGMDGFEVMEALGGVVRAGRDIHLCARRARGPGLRCGRARLPAQAGGWRAVLASARSGAGEADRRCAATPDRSRARSRTLRQCGRNQLHRIRRLLRRAAPREANPLVPRAADPPRRAARAARFRPLGSHGDDQRAPPARAQAGGQSPPVRRSSRWNPLASLPPRGGPRPSAAKRGVSSVPFAASHAPIAASTPAPERARVGC